MKIDLEEPRLAPPKPLEGLSDKQKLLHDEALEEAKQRIAARFKNNG